MFFKYFDKIIRTDIFIVVGMNFNADMKVLNSDLDNSGGKN